MKFVKLNAALIATALQQHEETGTSVPFNTSFHPASSAPDLTRPSDKPYAFKHWLPLILRTREQTNPSSSTRQQQQTESGRCCPPIQTVRLTRAQAKLLLAATEASLPAGHLNRLYREDLADELVAPALTRLTFPPEGLFLRLDECSPKDGAGPLVLRSVGDVLLKLVTSVRARNALVHFFDGGKEDGFELFFLPFDERMAADREYRVFCRPGDGKVSAISQYRWHRAWRFSGAGEAEQERIVRRVREGAEEVSGLILAEVAKGGTEEEEKPLLLEQGFSFDLVYDEERDACSLVELNTFGVRSACGSCLFQWVEDRKVLYGEEEAQFRVSVAMSWVRRDGDQDQVTTVSVSRLGAGEDRDGGNDSKPSEFRGGDWRGFLRAF
jgi:hypothetical protein